MWDHVININQSELYYKSDLKHYYYYFRVYSNKYYCLLKKKEQKPKSLK